MSVRETLELDISEALTAIEQVGDRLANVAQAFGEVLSESLEAALNGLPIITPEVDVESVSAEVEQALTDATAEAQTVEVDADTSTVTSEIDAAISEVDSTVEVVVEADTSAASQAVEQLGDSLGEAGASGDEAAGGIGGTAAAVALLRKETGSNLTTRLGIAGKALGAMGPSGVVAAAGIGAAVVSTGFLYKSAFESVAVTQAWENSLGDLGTRIEDLGSGTTGFSTNLRQLAQDVGSSDEAVLIATQRYAEFQRAAGFADDQIVENSQSIAVLAAQVRVNNPNLGTMDTIITSLGRSLQRGGPRLQAYGIALDTAAIQQRAFQQTGKETVEELTNAELSAAGLSLAMEQLDPTMGSVADGMENVAIKADRAREKLGDALETIGAPLVEPITDAFLELAKAFETFAGFAAEVSAAIGARLSGALEGLRRITDPLADVMALLADNVGLLGNASVASAAGVDVLGVAVKGLARNAIASIPILGPLINGLGDLNDALGGTEAQSEATEGAIRNTSVAESDAARITNQFYIASERTANGLQALRDKFAGVYDGWVTFADTVRSNVPTVVEALGQVTDETNADELTGNLREQIAATDRWTRDMGNLYAFGFENIAGLLAEIGPTQSAILLEQYRGREGELEEHLRLMAEAQQRAATQANEIALRGYLRMRDITGAQANAIVLTLGAELQLGVPTQEAIDEVIASPATNELRVLAAFGKLGTDATGAVSAEMNGAKGATIAGNLIDGMTKEMYLRVQSLKDAATTVADTVITTVNGLFGNASPSKVMMQTGRDVVSGLVLGLSESAPQAEAAMSSLTNGMLGVNLSAGAPSIRDVSVTVPVTVSGGMTADDGRAIGAAAGQAAGAELARMMRLEALVA